MKDRRQEQHEALEQHFVEMRKRVQRETEKRRQNTRREARKFKFFSRTPQEA